MFWLLVVLAVSAFCTLFGILFTSGARTDAPEPPEPVDPRIYPQADDVYRALRAVGASVGTTPPLDVATEPTEPMQVVR